MLDDATVMAMARAIAEVPGVAGVVLGGSRARGAQSPDSDVDLGVYLLGTVDEEALAALARAWSPGAVWTPSGAWGPWVDGGAWLTVDGVPVDWLRRDLARVDAQWERALRGEFALHAQPGHPHGFLDAAYCGELALGRVLVDPTGALEDRRARMLRMPAALGDALAGRWWEADFTLDSAAKAAGRGDATYVALCLAHAVLIAAHALHGRARAWSTNEKGLVAAAAQLPIAPHDFAGRAHSALALGAAAPRELAASVARARALLADVRAAVEPEPTGS